MVISERVLVTGASGYTGSNLVKALVSRGREVHIILREESNLHLLEEITDSLTIHRHDGSTEGMLDIIKKIEPLVVYHLASLVLSEHGSRDIIPLITSNITFGTQLVEAMVVNKVYNLINTGTSWQHWENKEYNPVCLYAATKQAFEAVLTYYGSISPLKVINLKLFDVYGPRDPRKRLFNLLNRTLRSQIPMAMSPGEQLIDLIYIDDVVQAFLTAGERIKKEGIKWSSYAVSSRNPIKLREVIDIYEKAAEKKLPINWGGRPYRDREVMIPWNSGVLLPGWQPQISIAEGIKRLIVEAAN